MLVCAQGLECPDLLCTIIKHASHWREMVQSKARPLNCAEENEQFTRITEN